jgi:hypothetical protein
MRLPVFLPRWRPVLAVPWRGASGADRAAVIHGRRPVLVDAVQEPLSW